MSRVVITVMPKSGVLDPEGQAVQRALAGLGFDGVRDARIGKRIELVMDDDDPAAAAGRMCDALLANPLIEDFEIEVQE
jgi:phosphoribosylformylglycinamidine synthase PurS subunit